MLEFTLTGAEGSWASDQLLLGFLQLLLLEVGPWLWRSDWASTLCSCEPPRAGSQGRSPRKHWLWRPVGVQDRCLWQWASCSGAARSFSSDPAGGGHGRHQQVLSQRTPTAHLSPSVSCGDEGWSKKRMRSLLCHVLRLIKELAHLRAPEATRSTRKPWLKGAVQDQQGRSADSCQRMDGGMDKGSNDEGGHHGHCDGDHDEFHTIGSEPSPWLLRLPTPAALSIPSAVTKTNHTTSSARPCPPRYPGHCHPATPLDWLEHNLGIPQAVLQHCKVRPHRPSWRALFHSLGLGAMSQPRSPPPRQQWLWRARCGPWTARAAGC